MYFQLFEAGVQNTKTQKLNLRTGSIEIAHIYNSHVTLFRLPKKLHNVALISIRFNIVIIRKAPSYLNMSLNVGEKMNLTSKPMV